MSKIVQAYRFAFNWGLARVKANPAQCNVEASYGLAGDDQTPWWGENSKEAYASGLANLATALTNWRSSQRGGRAGRRLGFPRFRGRRFGWSCRFTTGAFGLVDADPPPAHPDEVVGVDLGVRSLAVLSTGEIIANPKHLDVEQRELRRLQRQAARRCGPDRRTNTRPSNRWRKTQARIGTLHAAVASARRDGLHKLTTHLARTFGTIVIEDLNVSGMLANRRLARHIAGVGMGELRRQIEYKAAWAGVRVHVGDRWFPSSKTCSACRAVKAKLRLSDRTYHCDQCETTACGATGTATGRPTPPGAGQRRHGNASAQDAFFTRFLNGS